MSASAQAIAGQGALAGQMLALTMPPSMSREVTLTLIGGEAVVLHVVESTHLATLVPGGHLASV